MCKAERGMQRIGASFGALVALAGCGTGGSGAHAGEGGGSSVDAGDSGGEAMGLTPDAAIHPYGGRVVLEKSDQGKDVFFATAEFSRSTDRLLLEGCSDVPLASGSCCFVEESRSGRGGAGDGGVSAGSIAITRGTDSLGQLSYGADGYALLQDPPTAALSWRGGDTLEVTATGDVVEPFTGSVVAPQQPEILSVPEPHGSVLSLSIAAGSSMPTFYTWVPAGPPEAKVLLVLRDEATGSLKCLADDSAGELSIPPQLVGPNFHAHDSGYLNIGRLLAGRAPQNDDVEIASFAVVEWRFLFTE